MNSTKKKWISKMNSIRIYYKNMKEVSLKNFESRVDQTNKNIKNEELKKSSELLSTSKSQESQTIDVSTRVPQTTRMPYRHPNHRSRYNQHQIKAENKHCSSYTQTN